MRETVSAASAHAAHATTTVLPDTQAVGIVPTRKFAPEKCGTSGTDRLYACCRICCVAEAVAAVGGYEHLDRTYRGALQEHDVNRAIGSDIDCWREAAVGDQSGAGLFISNADPRGPMILRPRKMQG